MHCTVHTPSFSQFYIAKLVALNLFAISARYEALLNDRYTFA